MNPNLKSNVTERSGEVPQASMHAPSAHTQGTWLIERAIGENDEDCGLYINSEMVDFKYRGSICHVSDAAHIDGITKAERDANACLIVTAPDLLHDLRLAAKLLNRIVDVMRTCDDGEGEVFDLLLVVERFEDTIAKATGAA